MKTTNLLFTAQMVCRTLELKKRQTRRLVLIRPEHAGGRKGQTPDAVFDRVTVGEYSPEPEDPRVPRIFGAYFTAPNGADLLVKSPWGRPGDRLRVRESYRFPQAADDLPPRKVPKGCLVHYEAGGGPRPVWAGKLRPGIFLPTWASRIELTIESLRVERLKNIVEGDARAEGAEPMAVTDPQASKSGMSAGCWYREGFATLWDSLNADRGYPWDSNDWVWVIGFEVFRSSR